MASVTCGNCKNTHQSADAVKICYTNVNTAWQIPAALGFVNASGSEIITVDEYKALLDQWADEQRADIEAELAVERYFEDRGWDDARWEEDRFAQGAF